MSKATTEKRCRKKMARLLSLMGFHDDDPEGTIRTMRHGQKLKEIQEREANKNNQVSTNVKKVKFKCGGKQVEEDTNFADAAKNKRLHDKRVAIMYNGESSSSSVNRIDIGLDDSINHSDVDDVDDDDGDNGDGGGVTDLNGFIRSIDGTNDELVIEKKLTSSDVVKGHGRLLIPALQVMNSTSFLTRDEKWKLEKERNISVWVFDPKRRKFILNLGRQVAKRNYVLQKSWNEVVCVNRFKENMMLQVWSFRVHQQLCIALVRVK